MTNKMEQKIKPETEVNTEQFIHLVIGEVLCHETDVARQLEQGKSFAEHNKTVFDVAMAVAKFYQEQLDLRMDAYARERKALAEIEKLKEVLSRCRAANADYLTAKTEAENEIKILKQEVADIRVPYNRRERRLRDELNKVRFECQQACDIKNLQKMETQNKTITEDYVSFETAKLLAGKGFHGNISMYYKDNNNGVVQMFSKNILDYGIEEGIFYPAPTLQMTMKWLRERKIYIMIDRSFSVNDSWQYCICLNDDFDNLIQQDPIPNRTYEEAVEDALKYSLKNLI